MPSDVQGVPERMFVRGKPNGAVGRWHDATSMPETAAVASDGNNPMYTYILATPEALATDPAVQALVAKAVAEAEARGMERAADEVAELLANNDSAAVRDVANEAYITIRAEAATIRKGETGC